MSADRRGRREDYVYFHPVTTRWLDNDVYGHVNNVHYYAYFDSAINAWLIREGGLEPVQDRVVGFCVESGCRYYRPVRYPEELEVGVRVAHIGNRSVRYELGVFRRGAAEPVAEGHFVHVFVDRETERAVPIPAPLRAALEALRTAADRSSGAPLPAAVEWRRQRDGSRR